MAFLCDIALGNVCDILIELHPDNSFRVLGMKDILIGLHIMGVITPISLQFLVKTFKRNEGPSELKSLGFVLIKLNVFYFRCVKLAINPHIGIDNVYVELSVTL